MIQVIDPVDIIKDPNIGPVFDMNDDLESMAGQFTLELCLVYIKNKEPALDELMALLQWAIRQSAWIGMVVSKEATTYLFTKLDDAARVDVSNNPVFIEMYRKYGELLTGCGLLAQYWELKSKYVDEE